MAMQRTGNRPIASGTARRRPGALAGANPLHGLLFIFCILSALVAPVPDTLFGLREIFLLLFLSSLLLLAFITPLPDPLGTLEQTATRVVFILFGAWLFSSINLVHKEDLTIEAYLRGLTPLLGLATFRVGQHFRTQSDAFLLLLAVTAAGLLSAIVGSLEAIRYGFIDPTDMTSSIHFRSLLDSKSYDALVLSLPVALLGGGLIGTSRTTRPLMALGAVLFLFSMLTLMRSGIVIAIAVLLFELATIYRSRLLWSRFWARAPLILVAIGLLEGASMISAALGMRFPSMSGAVGAIGERHHHITDQVSEGFGAYRVMEAVAAWERFGESPILGHGLGATFSVGFEGQFAMVDRGAMRYTHNFFTYMLYSCGVIGIVAAVRFYHVCFRTMVQAGRLAPFSREPGVEMGLVLLLLGMLIYIQFQSMFRSATFFMMLGLVFGCLAARTTQLEFAARNRRTRQDK